MCLTSIQNVCGASAIFIPIITLLRNAAMNSLKYKAELALVRNQNIDITNFEEKSINSKKALLEIRI